MKWKEYEIYINRHFKRLFPNADIKHNVRRQGIVSKTMRQIDILVDAQVVGFPITIVIDCKCFSKKVDVKDVESFLSFLDDLKISKGIMITNVGYSEAAYNRATYDTRDVELRIINFSDLERFQGFGGIPYSRGHCAIVSAPDGWILDAAGKKGDYVASLYPAGLTHDEALAVEGFIYVVFSHKDRKWPDLPHLLANQDAGIKESYRHPRFEYIRTIKRDDCDTRLRVLDTQELGNRMEYTLFLDFPEVILFFNLLTPRVKADEYRRKLEWIGEKLIKGKVIYSASKKPIRILAESGPISLPYTDVRGSAKGRIRRRSRQTRCRDESISRRRTCPRRTWKSTSARRCSKICSE